MINFSKYKTGTSTPTTPSNLPSTTKIDFSKYKKDTTTPKPVTVPKTKISTLPDFLGGGSYNTVIGEPNTLLKNRKRLCWSYFFKRNRKTSYYTS